MYCLNRGEFYERAFSEAGLPPIWLGASTGPPLRLARFIRELRAFRPAVVQAAHFYVNLYVSIAASLRRRRVGHGTQRRPPRNA